MLTDEEVKEICERFNIAFALGMTYPPEVSHITKLANDVDRLLADRRELVEFAKKVESIMDGICGMQGFDFSEHAYPLRAALLSIGLKGKGYEIARKDLGTLIEHIKAAEDENATLKARVAELKRIINEMEWSDPDE